MIEQRRLSLVASREEHRRLCPEITQLLDEIGTTSQQTRSHGTITKVVRPALLALHHHGTRCHTSTLTCTTIRPTSDIDTKAASGIRDFHPHRDVGLLPQPTSGQTLQFTMGSGFCHVPQGTSDLIAGLHQKIQVPGYTLGMPETLTIALISDTFYTDDAADRLKERLQQARKGGATVAVLPELGCNRWCPATKDAIDSDAEPPNGPRAVMQAKAAAEVGITLVGGSLIRGDDGIRRNTALVFNEQGECCHHYSKIHIPDEPGFWEADHYDADDQIPRPLDIAGVPMGIQICSDINRPTGTLLLAAQGAEVILGPRSTEQATYQKWHPVFRANALTGACYVLSVNRPVPEDGVLIGGPSIAVAPDGEVLLETTDPVGIVSIDRERVHQARRDYPGYLAIPSDLYARAWSTIAPRPAHGPISTNADASNH